MVSHPHSSRISGGGGGKFAKPSSSSSSSNGDVIGWTWTRHKAFPISTGGGNGGGLGDGPGRGSPSGGGSGGGLGDEPDCDSVMSTCKDGSQRAIKSESVLSVISWIRGDGDVRLIYQVVMLSLNSAWVAVWGFR